MRIVYCIPHLYNSGGMERVLAQKLNWLAAHTAHTFSVLTTELVPDGANATFFPLDKRVEVVHLNIGFNADYTKPLLAKWIGHMRRMHTYEQALTGYIRSQQIDLCISLGGKEIAFLHRLPCRAIAEMHFAKDQREQLLMANHQSVFWALIGKIRTRQLVNAVRPLERLVVLTENDKKEWEKAGCRNVIAIPNPCALDGQKTPIKRRKKTILAVGRLHEQKGFDMLLQAWALIEKNYSQWSLRIVGEGTKRAELEAQIKTLGLQRAILAGRSQDVVNEYAEASLFVLSSRYEGFSLVIAEAMWCGTPCISFDCPHGPSELLADERGYLVPGGNVEKLAEQIVYVLTHLKEATARAHKAQAYAQATYSEQAIMPQWLQIINDQSPFTHK